MRYVLLALMLASGFVSAQTVLTVTERKVTVANGASYSSFKTNDEALKAASSLAAQACIVNPNTKVYGRITFEYTCAKSSASSSSVSSARSNSVSSVVSSVQSSVSQSSSSSIARITATWKCTLQREDGTAMTESEIGGYYLKVGDEEPKNLKHTGCEMAQIIDKPAAGVVVQVAEYDTDNTISKYAVLE